MATTADAKLSELKPTDSLEPIGRGLARLRDTSLNVRAQPLKEMRLELGLDIQVVYFELGVPVAGGVKLRLPVLTTVKPKLYSPTRAQHL